MKYLATILFSTMIFFSCTKNAREVATPQEIEFRSGKFAKNPSKKTLILQKRCLEDLVLKIGKGNGKGRGNGRPPKDTVVVDPPTDTTGNPPPPTSYYGVRVLYVNAHGKKVTTTVWTSPAYPVIDATPPSMNPDSVARVLVETAKAYFEFQNILVTDDSTVFNNTPIAYRQEAILTAYSSWYGNTAGGVAYRGSFGTGIECFVFSDLLSSIPKFNWAAVVHELGHTLGLPHAADGYYDVFGVWVLKNSYIISWEEFCNWMGAAYYSTYGRFEDWAYDAYGVKIYQKEIIKNTILK